LHADRSLLRADDQGIALNSINGARDAATRSLGAPLPWLGSLELAWLGGLELTGELVTLAPGPLLEKTGRILNGPVFSHLCPGGESTSAYTGQN